MISDFENARELFEAARDAAIERDRAKAQLEKMRHRTLGHGSSISGGGRGGRKDVNGTSASDAILDYETMMRSRLKDDERLLTLAAALTYGKNGREGVAAILGTEYADVLFWRYLNAETWVSCGSICHIAPATAKRRAMTALDAIDAVGIRHALDGLGKGAQAGSLGLNADYVAAAAQS